MVLQNLRVVNFRVYTDCFFEFSEKMNIIKGDNGSGKTSLLEAMHVLALTKSFRTKNDMDVIKAKDNYFQVFGEFLSDAGQTQTVNVNYTKNEGKKVLLNRVGLQKKTDIVGKIPVIVLSPANQRITEGGPSVRRDFINRIIAQVDPEYFSALIKYKKRMLQRNRILYDYRQKENYTYDPYVESYDELIAEAADKIFHARVKFITDFTPIFQTFFKEIFHNGNDVSLRFQFNMNPGDGGYKKTFLLKLAKQFRNDLFYGRTTSGPHLDQLTIKLGKNEVRQVASQGEHKVVLVALKMAESQFIGDMLNERIIFLLDDLFSLLDVKHCVNILQEISRKNQTFITTTDIESLRHFGFDPNEENLNILNLPIGES